MTTPNQPRSRSYDGALFLGGAAVFVIVIGVSVWLVALAVKDAPVVSAIFGVVGGGVMIGLTLAVILFARWAVEKNAAVHAEVASSVGRAVSEAMGRGQLSQASASQIVIPRRELADPNVFIPRQLTNQQPPGAKITTPGERDGDPPVEFFASGLAAALDILAAGEQPTRAAFQKRGIMSNTESSAIVRGLAGLRYIDMNGQGAPARWADGVTADSVDDMHAHLSQYVALPPPPQPMAAWAPLPAPQAGKAGRQAGRRSR